MLKSNWLADFTATSAAAEAVHLPQLDPAADYKSSNFSQESQSVEG